MERRHIQPLETMHGYDSLQKARYDTVAAKADLTLIPNQAYDEYFTLHKTLIPSDATSALERIHRCLREETMPDYLNVAAWAAAEVGISAEDRSAVERIGLIEAAERSWRAALVEQERLNRTGGMEYMHEDVATYRIALNLAYVPLIKALVVGNVTQATRERVFSDVLAIAQTAGVQRHLAQANRAVDIIGDMLGFEHECNAHLALLYMDDPRHLPLPSTARGGSGYDHPKETHDIMVINQHWGKILKIVPVEVKSKASLNDLKRYEALIVRGKMHLATTGLFTPDHTREAFAMHYEGRAKKKQVAIVEQVTATVKRLLQLYQRGELHGTLSDGRTRYHETDMLITEHPEFSLDRPTRY